MKVRLTPTFYDNLNKGELRQWYLVVNGKIPEGYKQIPYVEIEMEDLPTIMNKLYNTKWVRSVKGFNNRFGKASGRKSISEEY